MPESSRGPRIEVHVNGEPRCIAGLPGFGVITASVGHHEHEPDWVPAAPEDEHPTFVMVGSLDSDANEFQTWMKQKPLNPGDVVTFKVLPPGPYDAPSESRPNEYTRPDE